MADSLWYPSVRNVLALHEDIVAEYPDTDAGVRDQGDIEFALDYVERGTFGKRPETIHEKAYHLLRLLVANHPFVDGNKRTALNTVVVFYVLNGYRFDYDTEIRSILKLFGRDETSVDEADVIDYLATNTEPIDLKVELSTWREELVEYGLDQLTGDRSDQNG